MPLESATYISDLNTSNPVGSTDKVQTLDDHVRLIKSTLKTTWPNVNGAVNYTPAQANVLASMAAVSVLGRAANTAGAPAAIAASANDQVLRRTGDALSFGAVPDGALSSNVPLKAAANAYTSTAAYSTAGDSNHITITVNSAVVSFYGGGLTSARLGTSSNHPYDFYTNNTLRARIAADGSYDFKAGTVTTNNASAGEVGFKGTPQNAQNGDYTLVLTDAGKTIYKASGGAGETITIPANASVAFPVGTIVRIVNNGGGALTIAITSDTLSLAGAGTTGSRTLSDHGVAVIEKVASTEWFISGIGLS